MDETQLLERAISEIEHLRKEIESMKARLGMFDDIMSALHGTPARPIGGFVAIDVVDDLRKRIQEITDAPTSH